MSAAHIPNITDDKLSSVLAQSQHKFFIADFWAPWCGPCQHMHPIIDEVAGQLTPDVSIVKINVDDNNELAKTYSIRSIPTLLILNKEGKELDRMIGVVSASHIVEKLEAARKDNP